MVNKKSYREIRNPPNVAQPQEGRWKRKRLYEAKLWIIRIRGKGLAWPHVQMQYKTDNEGTAEEKIKGSELRTVATRGCHRLGQHPEALN